MGWKTTGLNNQDPYVNGRFFTDFFEHVGGRKLVKRKVADFGWGNIVDSDFKNLSGFSSLNFHSIHNDQGMGKVGIEQQVEKDIPDRSADIQTGNMRRNLTFGFQVVDYFRSKTVIPEKWIATPKY